MPPKRTAAKPAPVRGQPRTTAVPSHGKQVRINVYSRVRWPMNDCCFNVLQYIYIYMYNFCYNCVYMVLTWKQVSFISAVHIIHSGINLTMAQYVAFACTYLKKPSWQSFVHLLKT